MWSLSNIENMLNMAIESYGLNDIVTIMLNNERDKQIVEQQRNIYEEWKKKQSILTAGE